MAQIIKVIAKTFEILEILNNEPNLSLKEITNKVFYPKPTVFRLLNTLSTLGYVVQDNNSKTFSISSKFLLFINGSVKGSRLLLIAHPYMQELKDEFNETINLTKFINNKIIFIDVIESDNQFRISNSVGGQASIHSNSTGKVIFAFLPYNKRKEILENYSFTPCTKKTIKTISEFEKEMAKVKKQGFAVDNEEAYEGVICRAAPIFDKNNEIIAAISISMPKVRVKKQVLNKIEKKLIKITQNISSSLKENYPL